MKNTTFGDLLELLFVVLVATAAIGLFAALMVSYLQILGGLFASLSILFRLSIHTLMILSLLIHVGLFFSLKKELSDTPFVISMILHALLLLILIPTNMPIYGFLFTSYIISTIVLGLLDPKINLFNLNIIVLISTLLDPILYPTLFITLPILAQFFILSAIFHGSFDKSHPALIFMSFALAVGHILSIFLGPSFLPLCNVVCFFILSNTSVADKNLNYFLKALMITYLPSMVIMYYPNFWIFPYLNTVIMPPLRLGVAAGFEILFIKKPPQKPLPKPKDNKPPEKPPKKPTDASPPKHSPIIPPGVKSS